MPDSKREVRVAVDTWPEADLDLRAASDGGMTFTGYAAVFNSRSEDLGGFRETIAPGAFTRTLQRDTRSIRMFLNHNSDVVLASTRAGTLRLAEDAKGLAVTADLPDTTAGNDLATLLRRGDVNSMSFGFQVVKDSWTDAKGNPAPAWEGAQRTLEEVRLFEVSAVTGWPAYPATSAAVRSLAEMVGEDEQALADAAQALFTRDAVLSDAQRDLLMRAINARHPSSVVTATVAEFRQRFALAHGLS